MDEPLTTTFYVTLIGMGAVFLAMALIYLSMRILTTVLGEKAWVESPADGEANTPSPELRASDETRTPTLRAAAIVVALARSEEREGSISDLGPGGNTAWGDFYRHRQLRPGGKGRGA